MRDCGGSSYFFLRKSKQVRYTQEFSNSWNKNVALGGGKCFLGTLHLKLGEEEIYY